MTAIRSVTLRKLALPLRRPYQLSYRTFEIFEPFMVEIDDEDGRTGFSDAHISPGSSSETREDGWSFLLSHARTAPGRDIHDVMNQLLAEFSQSKVATTSFVTAIEVLLNDSLLDLQADTTLPLLSPVNSTDRKEIEAELAESIANGFRTFKVKVGKDVAADLARVAVIQRATRGHATLRLDANRAFSRDQALEFVRGLDPEGIELFEQPCEADEWSANGDVAAASPVPLMLDEPICTLDDIARAGAMKGVGYCKLKLKRFGGLERLREGMEAVRAHGMEPVLGDGLGSETHAWLESCVARKTLDNAGEFNGFLKPIDRLFENPLPFANGTITLPAGYRPRLDRAALDRLTTDSVTFS
jgi:L-alanine-DL-glutamate epimerase-like enolase superfamily enzyme